MKTLLFFVSIVFVANFISIRHAHAQDVPRSISYQGIIQTSDGKVIADGSYNITVYLYADSNGVTQVWKDTYSAQISHGLFNVILGTGTPLPAMDRPLWAGTQIGDGPIMKPLAALSSSPYALAIPNNSVTPEKMAADYVGALSVNGSKITGKGSYINLTSGRGLMLNYDPTTNAVIFSSDVTDSSGKGAHLQDVAQSITGTNHQVYADGTYGVEEADHVVLSLPQNIDSISSPKFVNVNLTNVPSGSTDTNVVVWGSGLLHTRTISSFNSGVTSITGTANQVYASSSTGNVTLSLPQNIDTGATPHFVDVRLSTMPASSSSTNVVVSNGGSLETRTFASLASPSWSLTGNTGSTAGTNFVGTTDSQAFEIHVNNGGDSSGGNRRVMRFEPSANGPNLIGGYRLNSVASGVEGATIAGGGGKDGYGNLRPNTVTGIFGTVGGGRYNSANQYSTVGGGEGNTAFGDHSVVSGGASNGTFGGSSAVVGGSQDSALADYAFVGGGHINSATSQAATVSGGVGNHATGAEAFDGGGQYNNAIAQYSVVSGGFENNATAPTSTIAGGELNVASGDHSFIGGGLHNSSSGYTCAVVAGGISNSAGSESFVGGGSGNNAPAQLGTIGGGDSNYTYNYGVVGGGHKNIASPSSFVGGGANNYTGYGFSTVGGGDSNIAYGTHSFVGGGHNNLANEDYGTVGGGQNNTAQYTYTTVAGGLSNRAGDHYGTVGGGANNTAAHYAVVSGGLNNTASANNAFIGGGELDTVIGDHGVVGGGYHNVANGALSIVAGGASNVVQGSYSTVGGGVGNVATQQDGIVAGGWYNLDSATNSVISGGQNNIIFSGANTDGSAIAGGVQNLIYHNNSFIGSGYQNRTYGPSSVVVGGTNNSTGLQGGVSTGYGRSFIGGGAGNTVGGDAGIVVGGLNNAAANHQTFVGGGSFNYVGSLLGTIVGGDSNLVEGGGGAGYGGILGGHKNSVGYFSAIGAGDNNSATTYCFIGGGSHNNASNYTVVTGGLQNSGPVDYGFIGGGSNNRLGATYSAIGGGLNNEVTNNNGFVGGGEADTVTGDHGVVAGGLHNVASGAFSGVGSGRNNAALGLVSVVVAGEGNYAIGDGTFIGGGDGNYAYIQNAIVLGGESNRDSALHGVIAGGNNNSVINGQSEFLGGGSFNTIATSDGWSVLVGGLSNRNSGTVSFIGGGQRNVIDGNALAFIGAGEDNYTRGQESAIVAGDSNRNTDGENYAFIGGGHKNTAQHYGFVGGGSNNYAAGYTAIAGGENNFANIYSAIPGGRNLALYQNSFGFNGDTSSHLTQLSFESTPPLAYFGNVDLWLGNVDNTARGLRFYAPNTTYDYSGANYTSFKAQSQSANITYTLPASQGAANTVLANDGSGNLSWTQNISVDTIHSSGPIESGSTVIVDGTSSPRSIYSDQTLDITTNSGDIVLSPAGSTKINSALDMMGNRIIHLGNPIDSQDAATKHYVDQLAGTVAYTNQSNTFTANQKMTGALNVNTLSVGHDTAIATGADAIAAGFHSTASGDWSVATGYQSNASNELSVAMGAYALASNVGTVALGIDDTATGDGAVAIGFGANGFGTASVAAGDFVQAGNLSFAAGSQIKVGANSFGFNYRFDDTITDVSAMNNIAYFGNVDMMIGNDNDTARALKFLAPNSAYNLNGAKYTAFKAQAQSTDVTYTLPASQGAANTALTNNGSGVLSWVQQMKNWVSPPSSSTASGTAGDEAYDSNYLYVCVASNSWIRIAKDTASW